MLASQVIFLWSKCAPYWNADVAAGRDPAEEKKWKQKGSRGQCMRCTAANKSNLSQGRSFIVPDDKPGNTM